MKKLLIAAVSMLSIFSCTRDRVVQVRALFTTNKDVYQVGEEIIISNESTVRNDILAFCKWTYGAEENMSDAYSLELEGISFAVPGDYSITLTAYAEQGADKDVYTKKIKVIQENDTPWADFECPSVVKVGEEVVFEDKSVDYIGGIVTWQWEIGSFKSSYESVRITFDKPAAGLEVSLAVIDSYGARGSVKKIIDVVE